MSFTLIKQFQDVLGDRVLFGENLNDKYVHIWRMNEPLQAFCYLLPKNTNEVAQILQICNKHNQPVIVYGGLTNLVGSTETFGNEVIISMEKMNAIEELDTSSRTITCQAGVILENIQKVANENQLLFPLNFGAKGSAQVGGIISTNAGGLRVLRYGMTRNLVLGLEVVLPDGTILNSMKKIIKDNSAYDIKQNFIGAEGTLGVITKAVLKLVEQPKSRVSAYLATNCYENVVKLLKHFDQGLCGQLSGFELIWCETYINQTGADSVFKPVLPSDYEYYILVECLGNHQLKDETLMQELLVAAFENGWIEDAAIAQSEADTKLFWGIREEVHIMNSNCRFAQHYDISLPIPTIGKTISGITKQLKALPEVGRVFAFGHVADGNIHFIIDKENDTKQLKQTIDQIVYSPLKALGGSVSAEHGIGLHKKDYLSLCRTEEEIRTMRLLKKAFDPNNILNRGKVL